MSSHDDKPRGLHAGPPVELAKQRGDDYNLLLNRFALERLLCRVAASAHADLFLLKGALLFSLWCDQPHRPTRDAELLGFGPDDTETLIATFSEITAIVTAICWAFLQVGRRSR